MLNRTGRKNIKERQLRAQLRKRARKQIHASTACRKQQQNLEALIAGKRSHGMLHVGFLFRGLRKASLISSLAKRIRFPFWNSSDSQGSCTVGALGTTRIPKVHSVLFLFVVSQDSKQAQAKRLREVAICKWSYPHAIFKNTLAPPRIFPHSTSKTRSLNQHCSML